METSQENKTQENKQPNASAPQAIDPAIIAAEVEKVLAQKEAEKAQENAKVSEEAKKPFKVKHKDETYEIPGTEKGSFVVRHSREEKTTSGAVVEDPGSVRIQYYRPEVYAELIREDEKSGKKNAFVEMGEKAIVLYDPTK